MRFYSILCDIMYMVGEIIRTNSHPSRGRKLFRVKSRRRRALPNQLTPLTGTETFIIFFIVSPFGTNQLTPLTGTETIKLFHCHFLFFQNQFTPLTGTETLQLCSKSSNQPNQLTPSRGRKNKTKKAELFRLFVVTKIMRKTV